MSRFANAAPRSIADHTPWSNWTIAGGAAAGCAVASSVAAKDASTVPFDTAAAVHIGARGMRSVALPKRCARSVTARGHTGSSTPMEDAAVRTCGSTAPQTCCAKRAPPFSTSNGCRSRVAKSSDDKSGVAATSRSPWHGSSRVSSRYGIFSTSSREVMPSSKYSSRPKSASMGREESQKSKGKGQKAKRAVDVHLSAAPGRAINGICHLMLIRWG